MNSKGIQPRVGMHFVGPGPREHTMYSPCWCNEWIPPTDEERVMFANSKIHPVGFYHLHGVSGNYSVFEHHEDNCSFCNGNWKQIAESLALDGMDIDDVSKIEELMK